MHIAKEIGEKEAMDTPSQKIHNKDFERKSIMYQLMNVFSQLITRVFHF